MTNNNREIVTQHNDEVMTWSGYTPTDIMLSNRVDPSAFVWQNDEFLGTLATLTQHDNIFQCDGCKRYFFSFDLYVSGDDDEYCYEFCSHLQPPE